MGRRSFVSTVLVMLVGGSLLAACAKGMPTFDPNTSRVVQGSGAPTPLHLVEPNVGPDAAWLQVTYDPGFHFGIEGGVVFLKSITGDGRVALDQPVKTDGSAFAIPPGSYRLQAYFRSCDGNCGSLDLPSGLCSVNTALTPRGHYRLHVAIFGNSGSCELSTS